jgi:RNA polymerase sigma-70 factor (ECF subfamily)
MAEDLSFDDLMDRLRAGDDAAARTIFERYGRRLIGLARTRLDALTRQKVDPEDVLQSVFRSFFLGHAGGQIDLTDWNSLWSMLVVITLRKCGRQIKYYHAARRDIGREVRPSADADDSSPGWEAAGDDPTPAEAAMLAETVENLMRHLDARERQMVSLSLQGYTIREISAEVGRTERTVHRLLAQVRKRLERLRSADLEAS